MKYVLPWLGFAALIGVMWLAFADGPVSWLADARAVAIAGALLLSTMSQLVKRTEVFLGKSRPPLGVSERPKVARQATCQALASIVDLDKRLLALLAAVHAPL